MKKMLKYTLSVTAVAALTACGGGGGSSGGNAVTSIPLRTVIQKVLTTAATYSATSSDGTTLSVTLTPGADAAFSAQTPISKTVNMSTLARNSSGVLDTKQQVLYFNASPLFFVAVEGRKIDVTTSIPETAVVSGSGQMYLSNGNGRGLFSTPPLEGTWSVEAANDGKMWACITNKLGYGLLSSSGFETTTISTYCFKSDEQGNISGFKASTSTDERSTSRTPVVATLTFGG